MMQLERTEPIAPAIVAAIESETKAMAFPMASDRLTCSLLRVLAASKPGAAILELGTGTGLSTAWLLDGMDESATLLSVDNDAVIQAVAARQLSGDRRVTFHLGDGASVLANLAAGGSVFDLIFADAWPGKYSQLETALALLKPGGLYVIDDMLPQPNWPDGHAASVSRLRAELTARRDLHVAQLDWATGIVIATKIV